MTMTSAESDMSREFSDRDVVSDAVEVEVEAEVPKAVQTSLPFEEGYTRREQNIEPGRALALTDFTPPALGVGERLVRFAYRMGINSSLFGKKTRLQVLATVPAPIEGDQHAGMALRTGYFLIYGLKVPIGQVDFSANARLAPPLDQAVHSFSWLADLDACEDHEHSTAIAERILSSWLLANPSPPSKVSKGSAWSISHAGHRVLNWLIYAPLILSGHDKTFRTRTLSSLNQTVQWLDRNVGRGADTLAQVTGWSAIVAASLLMPNGRARQLYGEEGLVRCLGELVGDDGGVLSRSPLAHIEAISVLVQLRACYRAMGLEPLDVVDSILSLLVPPLLALTHSDGSLGSWQGGWGMNSEHFAGLIKASEVRTRPLRDVRQWGYQRVAARHSVLQFDAAPPPLPKHARTGCASTLSFEFSHGAHRLIVNCGGGGCAGGLLPARLEQGLRATAAHSTLTLDDANSTAILLGGKIGGGVSEVEVDRRTLDGERGSGATRLDAAHNGYVSRFGLQHRRILILRDDGSELRGEDMLVPAGRKGTNGKVAFAIRFHLGPLVEAHLSDDRQGVTLALPDGSIWQFRSGEVQLALEESLWVDGNGRPVPIQQVVLQGLVSRGGGTFAWLLKKMG